MPITSGPSGVSSRIGEPDEAPPVSQVCSSSASGSAKSRSICVQSTGLEALGHAAGARIGELPGRVVAVIGDLEHVLGGGLAQDLLDRQHAHRQHALGAGRPRQPHQRPVARGVDRRAHGEAASIPTSRAAPPYRCRGRRCALGRARRRSCAQTRNRRIGRAARRAVPSRQWPAVAMTSGATQNAVHTVRRRRLKKQPDLLLHVLVFGRRRDAVVAAEHGHRDHRGGRSAAWAPAATRSPGRRRPSRSAAPPRAAAARSAAERDRAAQLHIFAIRNPGSHPGLSHCYMNRIITNF